MEKLIARCKSYLALMTPYHKEQLGGKLLMEATGLLVEMQAAIKETLEENRHLADGDNCTLNKLKKYAAN